MIYRARAEMLEAFMKAAKKAATGTLRTRELQVYSEAWTFVEQQLAKEASDRMIALEAENTRLKNALRAISADAQKAAR